MKTYRFPCGCEWPVLEDGPGPGGVVPLLDFSIEKISTSCPATWELIGKGLTKGVFQLESPLGRQWSKKLRPESLEHMSALGALLRPGCLRAVDSEGISMTQHYCRRKNGEEETIFPHPALEPILRPTYGVLTYQEQAMSIAVAVAGFDNQAADSLRKAIGKKLPEEMAKCEVMFVDGAKKAGVVTEEQAKEIFGWIKESQRYSFNKSHSFCYGYTGYECAYLKAHFPVAFYTAWLRFAKEKQDPLTEIAELVNDARNMGIEVESPDLRTLEAHFHTSSDRRVVRFGLGDIKLIGEKVLTKILGAVAEAERSLGKRLEAWTWGDFLTGFSGLISSATLYALIDSGSLGWLKKPRSLMRQEFSAWSQLTDKERGWVRLNQPGFDNLGTALRKLAPGKKGGGGCANKNRTGVVGTLADLLEHPPTPIIDTPLWVSYAEEKTLGISLTCSRVDSCDVSEVNTSCREYTAGRKGFMVFGVVVNKAREWKTKRGKTPGAKMAFLSISDATGALDDVVCFPDAWREYSNVLIEGNTVILQGERDARKNSDTLIVKRVWQAKQSAA